MASLLINCKFCKEDELINFLEETWTQFECTKCSCYFGTMWDSKLLTEVLIIDEILISFDFGLNSTSISTANMDFPVRLDFILQENSIEELKEKAKACLVFS